MAIPDNFKTHLATVTRATRLVYLRQSEQTAAEERRRANAYSELARIALDRAEMFEEQAEYLRQILQGQG